MLKSTRASAGGYVDTFEIRGIIEEHRDVESFYGDFRNEIEKKKGKNELEKFKALQNLFLILDL